MVLPISSGPTNWLLPFSTSLATSAPLPLRVFAHSMPPTMSREASSSAAMDNSFTALAFAPGVLNTTMPSLPKSATGMLL